MSLHELKYGEGALSLQVPDGCRAAELHPNPVDLPRMSPEELGRQALARPVQSPTLDRIVSPGQKVCIVISDISRLWQSTHVYVPAMVEALNACGIPDRDMVLLVATGVHRRHTPEEHARLVSANIARRIRVAVEADRIILCSGVVFHFLAGFGGGPRMMRGAKTRLRAS